MHSIIFPPTTIVEPATPTLSSIILWSTWVLQWSPIFLTIKGCKNHTYLLQTISCSSNPHGSFQAKLQHLINIDVLQHVPRSEWAFPTFTILSKDGRVRWVSDFRRLNKLLKRPRYFLPNIPGIMQRRKGFKFITKIGISMELSKFDIDPLPQKLGVISTPFGLYKYKRLPMGIINSPDFF